MTYNDKILPLESKLGQTAVQFPLEDLTINWQKTSGIILVPPINFLVGVVSVADPMGQIALASWGPLGGIVHINCSCFTDGPFEDQGANWLAQFYSVYQQLKYSLLPAPMLLAPAQFSYYPYTTPSPTDMVAHFLKHRDPVTIRRWLSSQIEQTRLRSDKRASPCLWRCWVAIWTSIPLPRKCPVAKSSCPPQTCGALIAGLIRAFKPILT